MFHNTQARFSLSSRGTESSSKFKIWGLSAALGSRCFLGLRPITLAWGALLAGESRKIPDREQGDTMVTEIEFLPAPGGRVFRAVYI